MFTVFVVLFLVVQTGNLLIQVVNRWLPGATPAPAARSGSFPGRTSADTDKRADAAMLAAIVAAVETVTDGQGAVVSVRRVALEK